MGITVKTVVAQGQAGSVGLGVVARDGIENFLLGFLGVDPAVNLDPFAGFEILVVIEKMRNRIE